MRKILAVLAVLGLVFIFTYQEVWADSPIIQNPANENSYQRIDSIMTWLGAKAHCESLGGHLATVTSAAEQSFIYDELVRFSPTRESWLGGTDEVSEGSWKWVTGEVWDYTNWDVGEPNNDENNPEEDENYLEMRGFSAIGSWNDAYNTVSGRNLVCEWEAEPNDSDGDGYTASDGDCNDNDNSIYPGAPEICGDGVDQDCDGNDLPCVDSDSDGIPDDGDNSGTPGDNPCTGGNTANCDDNCPDVPNPDQADRNGDGVGDVCDKCGSSEVFQEAINIVEIGFGGIGATFTPYFEECTLDDVAAAFGYDHFNWMNIITVDTASDFDNPKRADYIGGGFLPTDQNGEYFEAPWKDPKPGGYNYLAPACGRPEINCGEPFSPPLADRYPWYWDELTTYCGEAYYYKEKETTDGRTLNFHDDPGAFFGETRQFTTALALVREDHWGHKVSDLVDVRGLMFRWEVLCQNKTCSPDHYTRPLPVPILNLDTDLVPSGVVTNFLGFVEPEDLTEPERAMLVVCEYDFNYDEDVDGSDLAVLAGDMGGSDSARFALNFGKTDCID